MSANYSMSPNGSKECTVTQWQQSMRCHPMVATYTMSPNGQSIQRHLRRECHTLRLFSLVMGVYWVTWLTGYHSCQTGLVQSSWRTQHCSVLHWPGEVRSSQDVWGEEEVIEWLGWNKIVAEFKIVNLQFPEIPPWTLCNSSC